MTRRHRKPDVKNAGRSKLVPFVPGERATDRHRRRLETNASVAPELAKWAAGKDLTLRICNQGHHWIFERPGFFAGWRPSSAKLVCFHRYDHGVHCHDHAQVMRELGRELGSKP